MKQVRETAAGKSIGAWVILNPSGKPVATVQAHFSDEGVATVDIWHDDATPLQQGRARGYGYDKLTAALSGLTVDGHDLTNHCSRYGAPDRPAAGVWESRAAPIGYTLANYDRERGGFTDCYRDSGLSYLSAIGYRVIQAI